MADWHTYRAQIAALSRSRTPDDPELVQARQNLRAARLEEHVRNALADAPPLSQAQLDRVARLLVAPIAEAS